MYAAKPQQKTMEPNGDTVLQTGTTSVLSSNAPSGNSGTKPTLSTAVLSTAQSLPPNMAAGANNNMNHATLPQMMVNPDLARVLATAQFSTAAPKALFTPQQAPAPQPAVAPAAPNVDFLALARAVPGLAAIASGLGGSGDSSALELLQSLGLHQITNSLQQPQQQSSVAASAPNSTTMPPAASVPAPGASSAPSPVIPSPSAKASPVARVVPLAPVESTSNVDSLGNPSSNNAASSHPSPPPSPLNQTQKPTASENNSNTGGNSNPQGTIILPCRARGMPVDHNFRVRTQTMRVMRLWIVSPGN